MIDKGYVRIELHGPDGICLPECRQVRFGGNNMTPLPEGYSVWWHAEHEHYQGHGPGGSESAITVDRYSARRWCFKRAANFRRPALVEKP